MDSYLMFADRLADWMLSPNNWLPLIFGLLGISGALWLITSLMGSLGGIITAVKGKISGKPPGQVVQIVSGTIFFWTAAGFLVLLVATLFIGIARKITVTLPSPAVSISAPPGAAANPIFLQPGTEINVAGGPETVWFRLSGSCRLEREARGESFVLYNGRLDPRPVEVPEDSIGVNLPEDLSDKIIGIRCAKPLTKIRLRRLS